MVIPMQAFFTSRSLDRVLLVKLRKDTSPAVCSVYALREKQSLFRDK